MIQQSLVDGRESLGIAHCGLPLCISDHDRLLLTVGSCLRWWRRLQMKPWRCSSSTTAVTVSVIAFAASSTATWQCARGRGLPVAVSKPPPAAHCHKCQLASEALWWEDAEALPFNQLCEDCSTLHGSAGRFSCTPPLASWYVCTAGAGRCWGRRDSVRQRQALGRSLG